MSGERSPSLLGLLSLALVLMPAGLAGADDAKSSTREWHQYLGPDRAGVSDDTGLARSWPDGGPEVAWRAPLGEGYSGVTVAGDPVAGDLVYTMFADDAGDFAVAFRLGDGSEVWRRHLGKKFFDEWGNGPRSTPTIDGDLVYVLASLGGLYALDRVTGEVRWHLDLAKDYPVSGALPRLATVMPPDARIDPSEFAHAASPLVIDDQLIIYTGAQNGQTLLALDKRTGEVRWGATDGAAGFSSPALMTLDGQRQIVTLFHSELASVSLDGEELWRYPVGWTSGQPLAVAADKLLINATFDVGAMVLGVTSDAGKWQVEQVWNQRLLRHSWSTPVVDGDYVYGFDHATLRCLSLETGEILWARRGFGKATMILADGLLFILSDRGRIFLAEPSPEGIEVRGQMDVFDGPSWAPPTVARGKLFVRNHQELVAIHIEDHDS